MLSYPKKISPALSLLFLASLSHPLPAQTSAPAPEQAIETARNLFLQGNYSDALKATNKILALKADTVPSKTRLDMLMLTAESQLHLHLAAQSTLETCRKAAIAADDQDCARNAAALSFLIQKSPGGTYRPKQDDHKEPISILDTNQRAMAYRALVEDEFAAFSKQVAAAEAGNTLPPMVTVAKVFPNLQAIEWASQGATPKTDSWGKTLAKQAGAIVDHQLADMDKKVTEIARDANLNQNGRFNGRQPAGLFPDQAATLNNILNMCENLPTLVMDLSTTFAAPLAVKNADVRAGATQERAKNILAQDKKLPPQWRRKG